MMDEQKIVCPKCGKEMRIEADVHSFYCSHCGSKIFISIGPVTNSNGDMGDLEFGKEVIGDVLQYKQTKNSEVTKRKRIWPKALIVILVFIFAVSLLGFLSSSSFRDLIYGPNSYQMNKTDDYFEQSRKDHYKEMERLRTIEDEVLADIRAGKYEEAMLKAQTLIYSATYSNDSKEAWDAKRSGLISQLEALMSKDSSSSENAEG